LIKNPKRRTVSLADEKEMALSGDNHQRSSTRCIDAAQKAVLCKVFSSFSCAWRKRVVPAGVDASTGRFLARKAKKPRIGGSVIPGENAMNLLLAGNGEEGLGFLVVVP
jgi:hypothetical protein